MKTLPLLFLILGVLKDNNHKVILTRVQYSKPTFFCGSITKKIKTNMKQITISFLFLALLLLLQSCSNDDFQESALRKTSVAITTYSSFLTPAATKNVYDPSIFGNIKDITVTASQTETGYQANSLFTITNNLNDPTTYTLDNVEEGINTFTAVATSVTAPKPPSYSSLSRNASNSAIWNFIDSQVAGSPYAVYNGSVGPTTIDANVPMTLNIPMNTINGQFIAYFRCNIKGASLVMVTPYINEVAQASFSVTNTSDFYWIWNDSDCIAGKTVRFQCNTKDNGNPSFTVEIPNMTIKSHTTSKYAFDILAKSYTSIPRQ